MNTDLIKLDERMFACLTLWEHTELHVRLYTVILQIKQLGTSNKMLKFFREKNTKEEALEKLRQMEWVRNKQDSWHLSRFVNRKKLNPMR